MFIVLGIFAWVLTGVAVGVLDIWYRINYSTSTFWQTTIVFVETPKCPTCTN